MWLRGDLVTRLEGEHFEPGIVAADMSDEDEFLIVRWINRNGVEKIHRNELGLILRSNGLVREIVANGGRSTIEILEANESIEKVQDLLEKRSKTIKSPRENRIVDDLIRRYYAEPPECVWDRKNAASLILLALQPDEVGWLFKLRERLHRPTHALYHRH